ncbi:MAG: O-antigen ligase family protein [Chlamydiae bacterium]|nr:O-antigen ligase family protein [Chlamydiota bacterium]MBI3276512.1 O-antigen ligase family protein [Chlamydiota bacterium]
MEASKNLLIKMEWALNACLLAIPIALTFSRALIEILFILVILGRVLIAYLKEEKLFRRHSLFGPLLSFACVGILSLIHCEFLMKGFKEWVNLAEYLLITCIAFEQFSREKRLMFLLVQIIFWSSFVIALDGLVQFYLGHDLIRMKEPQVFQNVFRLTASFNHPNSLGIYLAMVIPIVLAACTEKFKWIYVVLLGLLLGVLILTYSRGSWLALAMAWILYALIKDKRLLIPMVILGIVLIYFLPEVLLQRMKDVFNFKNVTTQMRWTTWHEAFNLYLKKPWMGYGLKSFSLVLKKGYVHNCFLQILVEMGVAGFISFIWILAVFFKKTLSSKNPNYVVGIGCSVVAFTLHAATDTDLYSIPIATFFWFLLGVGISSNRENISDFSKDSSPSKKW